MNAIDRQAPAYFGVLGTFSGLMLLIWWMIN